MELEQQSAVLGEHVYPLHLLPGVEGGNQAEVSIAAWVKDNHVAVTEPVILVADYQHNKGGAVLGRCLINHVKVQQGRHGDVEGAQDAQKCEELCLKSCS